MQDEKLTNAVPSLREARKVDLLVRKAHLVFRALQRRGVQFDAEEQKFIKQLTTFLGQRKDMLEVARACLLGSVEHVAETAEIVVTITRDPTDLEFLVQNWRLSSELEHNESSRVQAGKALVMGYLALDQFNKAIEVAKSLKTEGTLAVETWLAIFEKTQHPEHLDQARSMATALPGGAQIKASTMIFEVTGSLKDMRKATEAVERLAAGGAAPEKTAHLYALLVRGYLVRKMVNEARELMSRIIHEEALFGVLPDLVCTTRDQGDWRRLLDFIRDRPITRPTILANVLNAAAACDQFDNAHTLAGALPTPVLRCFAFARLATYSANPRSDEALRQAEQLILSGMAASSEIPVAFREMVIALIAADRIGDAAEVAVAIPHKKFCCEACMLVYQTQQGQTRDTREGRQQK